MYVKINDVIHSNRFIEQTVLRDLTRWGHVCLCNKGIFYRPSRVFTTELRILPDTLKRDNSNAHDLTNKIDVMYILPIRYRNTGEAKQLRYADGTKIMNIQCIVFVHDHFAENIVLN